MHGTRILILFDTSFIIIASSCDVKLSFPEVLAGKGRDSLGVSLRLAKKQFQEYSCTFKVYRWVLI